MDNGLPQNSVKDIIKDKYGFIWITTENNVLKYDGRKFEILENSNLPNSNLVDFYGDIAKDSIVVFGFGELPEKKIILKGRKLQKSENRNIKSTITNNQGITFSLFNKATTGYLYSYNHNYYINFSKEQYFFSDGNKIDYVKNGKRKSLIFPYVNLKNIFSFNNLLFFRNVKQKKLFVLEQGELRQISAPDFLFDAETKIHWQQITSQVFLINNNKLYLGDFTNNQLSFKLLITHDDIKNKHHAIFYDESYNKVYLGSLTKGLTILTSYPFKNVPEDYVAYASLPFSSNTFIAPNGQEFGKDGIIKEHHFLHKEGNTFLMMYDDDKNIIYSEPSSLIKLFKNTNYQKSEKIKFGNSKIKTLTKVNNLYAVAITNINNKNFLYLYDNARFEKPTYQFQFPNQITHLSYFDENHLIVGSTDGLYTISLKNKKVKKNFSNIYIKDILKNKDGTYWITTKSQGIFLFKNSQLIAIPNDKNNALLSAHYLLEDTQNNLWISSNNGLFKTSKKEISTFLKDKKEKPHYYRYDIKNGLINNEFNGGSIPNAYQLENKNLVFPSFNGFVIFNPTEIKSYYPQKGEFLVERMRMNYGNIQYFHNKISVKSNFENLEILLDIPYYSNEANLHISVKQENQEWKDINQQRKFDISTLKPGNYKLTFRVFLGSGYDYKTVDLEVIPFFYQTNWFYGIIILGIILIILWIVYFSNKRLSGKNKKLVKQLEFESEYQKKLMETISHDITTPLKFISDLSQKIMKSNDPEIQKQYFESIHKSSEELYKFTSDMNEYAKIFKDSDINQSCTIYKIVEGKISLFYEIAKQKNIIILNHISPSLSIETNKNMLSVILHNIIDNAVKNSENSEIEIRSTTSNDKITITINDSGVGMNTEQLEFYNALANSDEYKNFTFKKKGLGLELVIQLIKKLNTEISFQNNLPKGTKVNIILKTNLHEKNINN